LEARDGVDERRLAGTVRPDQTENLAALEKQIDAVDGLDAVEADMDVPSLDPLPRSGLFAFQQGDFGTPFGLYEPW
jgi:hypothetical protein